MRRALAILKYVPAAVCELLVRAWKVSVARQRCAHAACLNMLRGLVALETVGAGAVRELRGTPIQRERSWRATR
jgi:hypothetical protein